MVHPQSYWNSGQSHGPVATTIRFFHQWLEQQVQASTDAKQLRLLSRLQEQLACIEPALFSPDPFLRAYGEQQWAEWFERFKRYVQAAFQTPVASIAAPSPAESGHPESFANSGQVQPVPIGEHRLPPLPYPYDALEPYIDEQTMRIHHDEHHQKYVDDLNTAERMMEHARQADDFSLIKHWEREAAFNGAGHYLHTLFWESMSPRGGGEPSGALRRQIICDFGSFDAFKRHFSAAAERVEGGGWALLVWSPRAHRLEILQAEKHQNLSQQDIIPLLPLDVWEHAYYLKYPNKRRAYIDAWWHVVNWPQVSKRFRIARQVLWHPY